MIRHEQWLCRIYERYLDKEGLEKWSCDELHFEDITDAQRVWLSKFYRIWMKAERS